MRYGNNRPHTSQTRFFAIAPTGKAADLLSRGESHYNRAIHQRRSKLLVSDGVFLRLTRDCARLWLLTVATALGAVLAGCSSAPAPLAIKLYNPKTNQTLFCNATDQFGNSDVSVLSKAVESCAQQLEAHGFVRE